MSDPHKEARSEYRRAIRQGVIVPEPCVVCGKEPADGHHDDYDKPLEVVWLCRLHHRRLHAYGDTVDEMLDQKALRAFAWIEREAVDCEVAA